ncbi:MAG: folate-binding protein YgfZ [Rhodospirillales bacterium]|nr:folate-binding protein YgfZ [Rhodospirillales bacterium]
MLVHLPDRAVLAVKGGDRVAFLQGLVSADVARAEPGRCLWSALLTPQGKYLADFFIHATADALLLDLVAEQAELVRTRLLRFRLRSKVEIDPEPLAVHVAWPEGPAGAVADPRLPAAGFRLLSPTPRGTDTVAAWERHRIALGLPEPRDHEPEKTVLLEAGFDELGAIAWDKGCWMGQELTARTRYRGLVKRRLMPVTVVGTPPPPGTTVIDASGAEAGTVRSGIDQVALATLRLDALEGPLSADGASLLPRPPRWMNLPSNTEPPA